MNLSETILKEIPAAGKLKPEILALLKRRLAKKYKRPLPANPILLQSYYNLVKNKRIKKNPRLEELLKTRPVRSLSGIVSVSVLTKPYPCPAKCLYCPSQLDIPKSYLKNEPAVMRAIANGFNPYRQVKARLLALKSSGHPVDKVELIVIGGTWSALPRRYQTWFIKRCFSAANQFNQPPLKLSSQSETLIKAQAKNERAGCRIIGITIETRPDFISKNELVNLRKLGVTRVELGVQSVYDDVLAVNNRGHNAQATIKATKLLKDAGFKVCYHLMPNLFGSSISRDRQMFKTVFTNPAFQPDLLKIYPCVVLKEAPRLYKMWRAKKYNPYSDEELIKLLIAVKKKIPFYCRIQRLIRDIPSTEIVAGCRVSNLRQVVKERLKKEGSCCRCIRCREIGGNYRPKEKLMLFREDYDASSAKEIFLSFEERKRKSLYSLLRLRIPSYVFSKEKHFIPALRGAAVIREVHTYGQLHPISKTSQKYLCRTDVFSPQHKGLGIKLIKKAEEIAKKEFSLRKIAVIAGVGTRNYYRKAGYKLEDGYMTKNI